MAAQPRVSPLQARAGSPQPGHPPRRSSVQQVGQAECPAWCAGPRRSPRDERFRYLPGILDEGREEQVKENILGHGQKRFGSPDESDLSKKTSTSQSALHDIRKYLSLQGLRPGGDLSKGRTARQVTPRARQVGRLPAALQRRRCGKAPGTCWKGSISARTCTPSVAQSQGLPQLVAAALAMSGRLDSNQRPLNPIQCCEWEGQLLRDAAASTYDNRSQENVGAASRVSRRF
jgi:hypothetical protein